MLKDDAYNNMLGGGEVMIGEESEVFTTTSRVIRVGV